MLPKAVRSSAAVSGETVAKLGEGFNLPDHCVHRVMPWVVPACPVVHIGLAAKHRDLVS
jgi:hypothetical protein